MLCMHFWKLLPLTEFCHVQHSLCIQVLRYPILPALLYGSREEGISQTLRRSAEGATYIRQGGHHVGHRSTFYFLHILISQMFPGESYGVR